MATGLVIHISSGDDRHTEILSDDSVRIGASENCDLRLRSSSLPKTASNSVLLELSRANGSYRVTEFNSAVPLTLNGKPVNSGSEIRDGDEFRIADSELVLHFYPVRALPAVVPGAARETHVAPFIEAAAIESAATARRDDIAGTRDHELWQKGVSACAVCDGALPMFRGKPLFVVGGGDSAMEEGLFLSKFGSKVYIVHRRDELRASAVMQDRARANAKVELLLSHRVTAVLRGQGVELVRVADLKTGAERAMPAAGLFFAIGHVPNTKFLGGQLATDDQGYILTTPGTTQTTVAGVFAAGDVQDKKYRQAITAAGSGCMAALEAEQFLSHHH